MEIAWRVLLVGLSISTVSSCGSADESTDIDSTPSTVTQAATDGDNSDAPCPLTGAPMYYGNRTYDPAGLLVGCTCITTRLIMGKLTTLCEQSSATCGYDYCMPTGEPFVPTCNPWAGELSFPDDTFYDPENDILGCACLTTQGVPGTLQAGCRRYPPNCGYLYCVAL